MIERRPFGRTGHLSSVTLFGELRTGFLQPRAIKFSPANGRSPLFQFLQNFLQYVVKTVPCALGVDKFLLELENQLQEKKVEAEFSDKLRAFLAEKGFDPLMGARPMSRLIQDTIRKALADELLFGRLASGGKVTIDLGDDEKIKLVFEETPAEAEPA